MARPPRQSQDVYKEKAKARVAARRAEINAAAKLRRDADPERHRAHSRRSYKAMPPRLKRTYHLRKRYGITSDDFDRIVAAQNGCCACCGKPMDTERLRSMHVDHDHATGAIRGVIHAPCNTGLGRLGDSPEGIMRALVYVSGAATTEALVDEHW